MSTPPSDKPTDITPRFGRLLLACVLSVIFCGVLVYLMSTLFADCCDLSWLDRLGH
jgi:hypothetical protein